jgi:hypothetical protein
MANPETAAEPSKRKRPGKSVWIRLAIYVPLLGFFGWQAGAKALDEREAADEAFRTDIGIWLESPPGMMDLSGAIQVQSEAMLSAPPETGETDATGDTGTTGDTGDTGTTGTTSDTGTTGEPSTTGEPGTTSETGMPAPDPVPNDATSTSTSTSTGAAPPP